MYTQSLRRFLTCLAISAAVSVSAPAQEAANPPGSLEKPSTVFKVESPNERLEMTVHSSRILTMDQKIPQAQVHNPDVLDLKPLSPNQVQLSAKAAGVTQVDLWGEDKKVYTIDVIVFGDSKELEMVLRTQFPNSALKVMPLQKSVVISGYIDKPEHIKLIVNIAEEYYPKVINNITVGGCQQVVLNVKIMEVSRTKLRRLGFDFTKVTGSNVVTSSATGLLKTSITTPNSIITSSTNPMAGGETGTGTVPFGVIDGGNAFFGVLDALRADNLAKILAEPKLTTVSGRPASFQVGGTFYIVPQGLAAGQPMAVNYGTQLDFVPIVLGNGRIRLDVRPTISNIDPALSVQNYPALLQRTVETGAELQAGQTLAIAGLVQTRVEAKNYGLPWISSMPYLGAAFRNVKEQVNEVELLIMVSPELVEAMDPCEVPTEYPGSSTDRPNDWQLYMKGTLEVPKCGTTDESCSSCPPQTEQKTPCQEPKDGMILGPGEPPPEPMPAPMPAETSRRPVQTASRAPADRLPTAPMPKSMPVPELKKPYSRYTTSKPNAASEGSQGAQHQDPPGLIGPVGYEVVK